MYENGDIDYTVYRLIDDHGEEQISGYYKNMIPLHVDIHDNDPRNHLQR